MHSPILSVVIPTYNRAKILQETLQAIEAQTVWDDRVELIVSNDCSTDGTKQVLQDFKNRWPNRNISIFNHTQNLGGAGNWQFCAKQAKGEFVFLLSDDDLILPAFIEKYLQEIGKEQNEDLGIIYSGLVYCREEDMSALESIEIFPSSRQLTGVEALKHQLQSHHMVMTSCYRRRLLLDAGGWDAEFGVHLDCSAFCLTALRSPKVVYLQDKLFKYRITSASWSGFRLDKVRGNLQGYRRKIDRLIAEAPEFAADLLPFLRQNYRQHGQSLLNSMEIKFAHGSISRSDLFRYLGILLEEFPELKGSLQVKKMYGILAAGTWWLKIARKLMGKNNPYNGRLAVFHSQK